MNSDFTLESITQTDVDNARTTLINLIQSDSKYANLDFRAGTALNNLLLLPQSELWALEEVRINFVRNMKSLQSMLDTGEAVPVEMVNDVLSNFSISIDEQIKATGQIIVKRNTSTDYTISDAAVFTDPDGNRFITQQAYSFSTQPTGDQRSILTTASGDYYFVLPVIAEEEGEQYMLKEGTPLTPSSAIFGLISSEAYADFTGATSQVDLAGIINELPAAISHRSLESRKSIESILTDTNFGNFTNIRSISVVGAGDLCQLRDKHNHIGASTFGRVDIYPRTFEGPTIVTLQKTGTRTGPETYEISIDASDAPGYYAVKSVTDADSLINPTFDFDTITSIGSYSFTDTREPYGINDTFHDISNDNSVIETAYTMYQQGTIVVTGVTTAPVEDHLFKVELYSAPNIADIQNYVDGTAIKNVKADYLVRSPLLCLVGLRVTIDVPSSISTTVSEYKSLLAGHINNLSFTDKLTQSELVGLLINNGVRYVDLSNDTTYGFKMEGRIRAADGSTIPVYGPNLSIPNVENEKVLVAANTCVFAADLTNIFITLRKI